MGAVEGDQQVEVRQGRRELLQIPALDELLQAAAVIEAYHGDRQPRPVGAGGFDVQVADPGPKGAKQAPMLSRSQAGCEVAGIRRLAHRFPQLLLEAPEPLPGQAGEPGGAQKIVPGPHPLPPKIGLAPRPHPVEVDKGALQHGVTISSPSPFVTHTGAYQGIIFFIKCYIPSRKRD